MILSGSYAKAWLHPPVLPSPLAALLAFEVLGKDLLSLITYPNGALCYKGIPIQRVKKVAKCSLQGLAYMHDVTRVFRPAPVEQDPRHPAKGTLPAGRP